MSKKLLVIIGSVIALAVIALVVIVAVAFFFLGGGSTEKFIASELPETIQQYTRNRAVGVNSYRRGKIYIDNPKVARRVKSEIQDRSNYGTYAHVSIYEVDMAGYYEHSDAEPYVIYIDVTLYDHEKQAFICKKSFRGSDPPKKIAQQRGRVTGDVPYEECVNFFESLSVPPADLKIQPALVVSGSEVLDETEGTNITKALLALKKMPPEEVLRHSPTLHGYLEKLTRANLPSLYEVLGKLGDQSAPFIDKLKEHAASPAHLDYLLAALERNPDHFGVHFKTLLAELIQQPSVSYRNKRALLIQQKLTDQQALPWLTQMVGDRFLIHSALGVICERLQSTGDPRTRSVLVDLLTVTDQSKDLHPPPTTGRIAQQLNNISDYPYDIAKFQAEVAALPDDTTTSNWMLNRVFDKPVMPFRSSLKHSLSLSGDGKLLAAQLAQGGVEVASTAGGETWQTHVPRDAQLMAIDMDKNELAIFNENVVTLWSLLENKTLGESPTPYHKLAEQLKRREQTAIRWLSSAPRTKQIAIGGVGTRHEWSPDGLPTDREWVMFASATPNLAVVTTNRDRVFLIEHSDGVVHAEIKTISEPVVSFDVSMDETTVGIGTTTSAYALTTRQPAPATAPNITVEVLENSESAPGRPINLRLSSNLGKFCSYQYRWNDEPWQDTPTRMQAAMPGGPATLQVRALGLDGVAHWKKEFTPIQWKLVRPLAASGIAAAPMAPLRQGQALAIATEENPAVYVYDLATGKPSVSFPLEQPPDHIAVSRDDQWLAAARQGVVRVWRISDGANVAFESSWRPSSIQFDGASSAIVGLQEDGLKVERAVLSDLAKNLKDKTSAASKPVRAIEGDVISEGDSSPLHHMAAVPNSSALLVGRHAAALGPLGESLKVTTASGRPAGVYHNLPSATSLPLAVAATGTHAAAVDNDEEYPLLFLYQLAPKLADHLRIRLPRRAVRLSFSPDGRTVATVLNNGAVQLLNAATGETTATIVPHTEAIHAVLLRGGIALQLQNGAVELWALRK